jgi:hypothetical protein
VAQAAQLSRYESKFQMLAREMDVIVERGYVIIGSPDEVATQLREVVNNLNVGHLMMLLQFGNMGKDLTKYNTQLFAERVTPQLHDVFRLGGPLVAAADGPLGAGALYDKISREDILAHAYAQCRSNKSLPLRRRGAHREQTVRILRTSKRMGSSGGWLNWRLRSERRHSDRSRSDACTYRRPTANSGRWASRPCGIGSA